MKAAWDWELPRETAEEERALVEFAADLGFDTLIVHAPTEAMVERGHELGLAVVAIVKGQPTEELSAECTQVLHPVDEGILEACELGDDEYQLLSHAWFPPVHRGAFLCLGREASLVHLEDRITRALSTADGVAFDGFGFRNHYACFCEWCEDRRAACRESTDIHEYNVLARVAEAQLVEATERLYTHAKTVDADALVTNHVWPPFSPNPDYGHRLELDYCSQTISWFYPPSWSLDRVGFEARKHARLAAANTFVPFIGMFDRRFTRRTPERLRAELDLALEHGEGHLVFSTLAVPNAHHAHAQVLRQTLREEGDRVG